MSKISLIIKREYFSRVKKRSFIIMSLVGPLLFVAIFFARFVLALVPEETQQVLVIDETNLFRGKIENSSNIQFYYEDKKIEQAKREFYSTNYNVIVYVPFNILSSNAIQIFYKKQPGISTQEYIKENIGKQLENFKLLASGIDRNKLKATETKISSSSAKLTENGVEERSSVELNTGLGFAGGMLIYVFIFLFGAQVMRGVMEEKINRVVEVIISSVRPFQLMMGKIIGVALVGLTQFLLWIILILVISSIGMKMLSGDKYNTAKINAVEQTFKSNAPDAGQEKIAKVDKAELSAMLSTINIPVMVGMFVFYFLGGYLLYGALFAAIGGAVDSETDTQQFMLPISLPLVLGIIISQQVVINPTGPIAFWFSIFPFTSPIVMMARIPFGVPYTDLILSILCLIGGFIFTTWLAAKIYRTGILMYGKKITYKEIAKWLKY
jgi:ABC-2 type transport system permease protein